MQNNNPARLEHGDAPRHAHYHALAPSVTHLPCPEPRSLHGCPSADAVSPAERYAELFVDIQSSGLFADSKTFPDCAPLAAPEIILARYREQRDAPDFSLKNFVEAHFAREHIPDDHYESDPNSSLREHIDGLWPVLTREPGEHPPLCSLLPLPKPYVVPGGRFRELYYWDSYFTMLGLSASGRYDLMRAMADNFAYLLDTYGLIPNGTRTYYLSRSQPPVFTLMVDLFEDHGIEDALAYLPQLQKEYAFWMDGVSFLRPGAAHRRVVMLPDGRVLNRYWDDRAHPREEAYLEDIDTARRSGRPAHLVFRDLRAAAESGWDFSSRWCDLPSATNGHGRNDDADLATIRTTAIAPVDLNALLWHAEANLAELSTAAGDPVAASRYREAAARRAEAISATMWDEASGTFLDLDWHRGERRPQLSAATLMPLFLRLATTAQAARVADAVAARLLEEGGLATTECNSGQQWDRPNGWAPLQWIGVRGLRHYGHNALADTIANRWLATVASLYTREFKLVEKYRLRRDGDGAEGGSGGEYPLQDGFGWTNGVVSALLQQYPDHPATDSRAGCPDGNG
ncbi:alpha,alpha-trehalase TreF [Cupriavidus pampae]|uniref:Cytoplasmic trehalase n=1 Tax=Cupriavidus pampae TaxID=659251 RepID=A0ABN7YGX1_9BURK|nr:alpha,alpha-trehalase TreF [Cupriavidus pampae]CAG9171162.1 Cytoplasmic trehalase [Cupriavidus pampae]